METYSHQRRRCKKHHLSGGAETDSFFKTAAYTTPWAKYISCLLLDDKHICILQTGNRPAEGKADRSLLYYYPAIFPFTSRCMYTFPSAGASSCLIVLYTDNVYHWAALDYFHTCLFYTVHTVCPQGWYWGLPVWLMCVEISSRPQTAWLLYSRLWKRGRCICD